jgi:hypothetical protein
VGCGYRIRKTLVYAVRSPAGFGVHRWHNAAARGDGWLRGEAIASGHRLTTLAIAVLFNQYAGVQEVVDRRFFRHKYGGASTDRVCCPDFRDEVDIESVEAALMSALEATVHPVQVSLWLEAGGHQATYSQSPSSREHRSASQAMIMEMDIAPDDPAGALAKGRSGVIEIEALGWTRGSAPFERGRGEIAASSSARVS